MPNGGESKAIRSNGVWSQDRGVLNGPGWITHYLRRLSAMSVLIDIGPATLEGLRPELVIVRFKSGTVAGAAAFAASMNARRAHFAGTPHVVVLVAPDDADFDPGLLGRDQYAGQGVDSFTRGLAFVGRNPTLVNIIELYYALHPAPFPVRFFQVEPEALAWAEALVRTA